MALFARATSIFLITNRIYSKLISSVRKSVPWTNLSSEFTFCGHFICRRYFSDSDYKNQALGKFRTFDQFLENRRSEARRSILVELDSESYIPFLHHYCSNYGKVVKMYHYSPQRKTHYVLIEFENNRGKDSVLRSGIHENFNAIIPARSSCFFFRRLDKKAKASPKQQIPLISVKSVGNETPLINKLSRSKSVSGQLEKCYTCLKLDDLELRLRFYISYEIECCFMGIFPLVQILPFGSTVNGFGKMGCDLDLFMDFDKLREVNPEKKLVFKTKHLRGDGSLNQNSDLLRIIGDFLETFSPGIENVIKILHARVPIIKFTNKYTGVQCDLSFSNMSAVHMSELLYLYGEIDSRVRPIVFAIRKWAKDTEITCEFPGGYITNFSLTLLILFYFQQRTILPTLNELQNKAQKSDVRITNAKVDCTFLRDVSTIRNENPSTDDSFDVLKGFFEYYSNFNFKSSGICLRKGAPKNKTDSSALFIHNPLEPLLNVSRNVSYKEIDKFRFKCREAFWKLQNTSTVPTMDAWGILVLFKSNFEKKNSQGKYYAKTANIAAIMSDDNQIDKETNFHFASN